MRQNGCPLAGNHIVAGRFLALTDQIRLSELNQRNEPCRRRTSVYSARTVRFPRADPAAEYRHRSARSISVFGMKRNDAVTTLIDHSVIL